MVTVSYTYCFFSLLPAPGVAALVGSHRRSLVLPPACTGARASGPVPAPPKSWLGSARGVRLQALPANLKGLVRWMQGSFGDGWELFDGAQAVRMGLKSVCGQRQSSAVPPAMNWLEEEKARGQCIAQHTESTVARSLAGTITEVRPYWVWGSAGGGISGVG